MAHGNKKYFFEELKQPGDTILAKPNPSQVRVNVYSLKNQIKNFFKFNEPFEYEFEEHKNGTVTIKRIA